MHRHFDFSALPPAERYKILSGAVLPRPVALITTRDVEGRNNAAPFSFFGVLDHDPAVVAVGIGSHDGGRLKDTWVNIRDSGVFTLHIPDVSMAGAVEVMAQPHEYGVDETRLAGLETQPGRNGVARILAAPAAFECRLSQQLPLSHSRAIIIAEVEHAYIREDAVNARLHIDPAGIDALARLGGQTYATIRDRFPAP